MVKNASKREKNRAWTTSTFSSDGHSVPLHAISENAMDEDTPSNASKVTIIHSALSITSSLPDSNYNNNSGDFNGNSEDSDDHIDDEDDSHDQGTDSHDNDDDDDDDDDSDSREHHSDDDSSSSSSQDHDHSDDSDDAADAHTDEGMLRRLSRRIDVPKRTRSGSIGSKSKKVAAGLSTSPSNPSKIVSATPTKKITKKSKVSVKPKSSKGSLSSAAARQATEEAKLEGAKPIVSRFLELENAKLNDKLLQVFMINGILPFVVEFITRLDTEYAKEINEDMDDDNTSQESRFLARFKYCRRKRDFSDINLMKKSYTTMNFLIRNDVYNEFILNSGQKVIVKELFKIFRPESNGNFYHFQKVFETILKKSRTLTMATLFEVEDPATGETKTPLVLEMLPFVDQAPVALSLIKVIFPAYTYGFAEKVREFYQILHQERFMENLLAMVTLAEDPTPGMCDFVVSLLDEATRAKDAKMLFTCLSDDPIWAERLAKGVQSDSAVKRHGCIEIIYSILVRSIQMPFQDMFASSLYISEWSYDKVDSFLETIANGFGKHLAPYIPNLCQTFIESKNNGEIVELPGYTVPKSFTVARLWLLDSIYHCLSDVKDIPSLLESIPAAFWSNLVDSFIQFRFNNAFHVQFYKMFRVALYSEQASVYDRFFIQTDIIKRLIGHYLDVSEPTGSRGYIILILNCIRLSADVEQQAAQNRDENAMEEEAKDGNISATYWTDILRDHTVWKDFVKTLRHATLKQTRDTLCDMDPNLRFQFAPLQSRQPSETPMTKRHIGIPSVSARGTEGIDLGSQYGNSLGFGVPMKYDRAADEAEKEKSAEKTELEVQKALASIIPSVDWKLIPPQRVLNAMKAASAASKAAVNKSRLPAPGTAAKETNGTQSTTTPTTTTTTTTTETTSATSKSKKKKKNKKKRASSSSTAGDPNGEEEEAGHSDSSTSTASSTNGSILSDISSGDSSDGGHEKDSGTEGEDTSEDESRQSGETGTTGLTETEEELLKRRREKKREKKRKNKMNKKNRIANEASRADTSDSMDLWG